ncbi:MAG: ATP-binding cassette domain-containing protein, partial [Clostridia bacterium]|nr:ATP-binding cassette domain-containing protein [Clostridia bacterium]
DEFRSSLGYLPQSTKLMPRMNIVEFLDYVCVMKGIKDKVEREERIRKAIETVGLVGEEKKRLRSYSGGMLRRAGIAQALIGDPKVLIIDEPTTGLDPEERLYFLNLLSKIARDRTIIFSTHITADIEHLCQNICVLEQGEVKYLGVKGEFIDRIEGKLWEHTGTPEDEEMLRRETTVTSVTYVDGNPRVRYVADEAKTENSQNIKPTLEDAYIYALGGVKR